MVLMLILILQVISIALWFTSSGLTVQRKIRNRTNALVNRVERSTAKGMGNSKLGRSKFGKTASQVSRMGSASRNLVNSVANTANTVAVTGVKVARTVVEVVKSGLLALLPLILLFDVIIFVLVAAIGSAFMVIHNSEDGFSTTVTTTVGGQNGNSGFVTGTSSKIVLVGDSRTYGLAITVGGLPTNENSEIIGAMGSDYVICKGGMGYDYMTSHVSDIESQLGEDVAVVIAMGVNGCEPHSGENVPTFAERYANQYADWLNDKATTWASKGAKVYFVSVNPVNDDKAKGMGYTIKNEYVKAFNEKIKGKLKNVGYIDTYSQLESGILSGTGTEDGLHYTQTIYETIKNYIWKVVKGG